MSGQSSARRENSGKSKISSVTNAGRSNVFAKETLLATKYEILKENHELLLQDYKILQGSYKVVNEMNEMMQLHLPKMHNQPMKPDAKNLGLLKDLETERSEKEEYKKMIEGMKRMECEKEAMINELRIKNQELLIAKEKEEEEYKKTMVEEMKRMESEKDAMINELRIKNQELLIGKEKEEEKYKKSMVDVLEEMKRMESEKDAMINELTIKNQELLIAKEKEEEKCKKIENKCVEFTERFGAVKSKYSFLKSLYNAENAISQGGNNMAIKNDVIVLDDHNVNNTVADPIVISDESDGEKDNPPRKSNITRQRSVGREKEEQCSNNGANSPKVNHQSSSSSSSSDDDHMVVQLGVKRSRDDYNRS